MLQVVFTGPAIDGEGYSITRANLEKACSATCSVTMQNRVDSVTDLLVASRMDTVKALQAAAKGVTVLTYPEFISRYLKGVNVVRGGIPNRYTDVIDQNLLVPDFTEGVFSQADML